VPRISRLLALAHRLDELVRTGVIADYATLAELAHVSRGRMSQIMNRDLICLADFAFGPKKFQGKSAWAVNPGVSSSRPIQGPSILARKAQQRGLQH
jgi:hypothetical protein